MNEETKGCRVCRGPLTELLFYENMPKAAQHLPDELEILKERGEDLQVVQCLGCGLVQLGNQPVSYYKEVIRASAFSEEMKKFRISQFNSFVKDYNLKNKKILEVGCGGGEYLSLMKNAGADVYGIEYSQELVRKCLDEGLRVQKTYLEQEDDSLLDSPFDGFFILNFLEHFPHPRESLLAVYNNMKPGATGLIEVPNFDMMLRGKLFSEFISDHLLYFTKDTLEKLLSLCGFEILECKEIWYDYIISAVVRKKKPLDITAFYDHQEKIKNDIGSFVEKHKDVGVAVYGAGHQSFAILSLTNLQNKVKYVIDDALFKQGKYTPATHIPIVSADVLNLDHVSGVIIMAGGYSDEIAKKLFKSQRQRFEISILRDFGLEPYLGEESA